MDQFSVLVLVHIQRVNSCYNAMYHATARYAKTRYWRSAKAVEAENLATKWDIFAPNPCFAF